MARFLANACGLEFVLYVFHAFTILNGISFIALYYFVTSHFGFLHTEYLTLDYLVMRSDFIYLGNVMLALSLVALIREPWVHIVHVVVSIVLIIAEACIVLAKSYVLLNCGDFWYCYGMSSADAVGTTATVWFYVSFGASIYALLELIFQLGVSAFTLKMYGNVEEKELERGFISKRISPSELKSLVKRDKKKKKRTV